jgi:G:T-mismatch repair DNA endonuclease (very short patch repair protein)
LHGCFWHGHGCKRGARTPKTNVGYWVTKIARNVARDAVSLVGLKALGWRALAAIGHHHHIAGAYLRRYAQEVAWREDNRRVSNGGQVHRVVGHAMKRKP